MSDNQRKAWEGWPNPFDARETAPSVSNGQSERSGEMSEAAQLRRSAEWFERRGETASAILFRNAAFICEEGCEWLEYINREGRTDDVEVREC